MAQLNKKTEERLPFKTENGRRSTPLSDFGFGENNESIGMRNSEGEYLYVPKQYFDYYIASNPSVLAKVSELVEQDRCLAIGVRNNGFYDEESVTEKDKRIFVLDQSEQDEVLFPELEHGQMVELEGELTRGNEMSNTMGFGYKGHILTCLPSDGSIVRFKPSLFLKCRIDGVISRMDEKGRLGARKPKIIFTIDQAIFNLD